jgi:NAD(P)-dependent dehydrogenase (short-subunit alcohol dehydrogenase family)
VVPERAQVAAGPMHATRAALPHMIDKRWGRVIMIVSDAGRIGQPGMAGTPSPCDQAVAAPYWANRSSVGNN